MSDELIMIDGYNVIFGVPVLRDQARIDLERARDELVRRIGEAFRGRRERITIVFDGNRDIIAPKTAGSGGVRVVFSVPPETADHRIQRLVEEARRRAGERRLTLRIVSSDREVAGRARLWGAEVVGGDEFLRQVEERRIRGPKRKLSREPVKRELDDIAEWERLFRERRANDEDPD